MPLINPYHAIETTKSTVSDNWSSLFRPIQETETKHRDVLKYVAKPFTEAAVSPLFLLEAMIYAVDAAIHLLQALAAWSRKSTRPSSLSIKEQSYGIKDDIKNVLWSVAAALNVVPALLSWVTRPVASVASAIYSCATAEKAPDTHKETSFSPA